MEANSKIPLPYKNIITTDYRPLIEVVEHGETYEWKGVVLSILLFIMSIAEGLLASNCDYYTWVAAMRVRSITCAALYRKVIYQDLISIQYSKRVSGTVNT